MDLSLDSLHSALDQLVGTDLDAVGDDGLRAALVALEAAQAAQAAQAKLDAAKAVVTGAFDGRRVWADDDAVNAATWLRVRARVPGTRAGRQVRHARALRGLPHAREALAGGRICSEVVGKLIGVDSLRTRDALREDEADLVEVAARERFDRFCRQVDEWRLRHDPDGAEPGRRERRRVHLSESLEGMWVLDGLLDPISGTTVATELERIEHRLFTTDWAEARERLGREPTIGDLARIPGQRRADALVEMARQSAGLPDGARTPRALVTIVRGADRFTGMCRLLDGTVLSNQEAAAVLSDAVIERITFDGPDRPFTHSAQRCFTGALRRAIQVRDDECVHPMCDARPSRCEVDHIQPAARGGATSIDNGRLLCGHHNRSRHRTRPPPDDDPD